MLKESLAKFLKLDSLLEHVSGYVETRMEIMKYDLKEDAAKLVARIAVVLMLGVIALFFLVFASAAVAYWLSVYVGIVGGLAIVGALYLTIGVVLYSRRKILEGRIENQIKQLIKQKK